MRMWMVDPRIMCRQHLQLNQENKMAKLTIRNAVSKNFTIGQRVKITETTVNAEQSAQPASKYPSPADVSTRAGQMELAYRAGRIASLKAMNGQLRQIAPNEAWADANIESANDLDALQDQISEALVAAGKGTAATGKSPDTLRAEREAMSGAELKAVFAEMNLAGKILTYDERVGVLMAEDADEVRAAIVRTQPASEEQRQRF